MTDEILHLIGKIETPGFFITADFIQVSDSMPLEIESFILQKLEVIRGGATARKFTFKEGEWRIFFTFFPTDRVVDKKYAMMNKALKNLKDNCK